MSGDGRLNAMIDLRYGDDEWSREQRTRGEETEVLESWRLERERPSLDESRIRSGASTQTSARLCAEIWHPICTETCIEIYLKTKD